jgi:signal transduction histidine kinase
MNLVVNARDAMPGGGKLTIETSNSYLDEAYCAQHPEITPGQYVQIAATDTGAGMPKSVIDRAFEPFFTTKPSGQGTGLGLSQVYGFVKQSGGHVKIYSEPNEGTTVSVYFNPAAGHSSSVLPPAAATNGGTRGRILVVDDDADVRAYVAETLGGLGYDVLEAANGGVR